MIGKSGPFHHKELTVGVLPASSDKGCAEAEVEAPRPSFFIGERRTANGDPGRTLLTTTQM